MQAEPQREHRWLDKLLGEWTFETECDMGPGQPPMKSRGTEVVRSLGGLWILAEGENQMPEGEVGKSLMMIGYDPASGRYVGTFVASMMTHLWVYNGTLDAGETALTLDTEGPDFSGGTGMVPYQDRIEFVDDDHRVLSSHLRGEDGEWRPFMTAHYRRESKQ